MPEDTRFRTLVERSSDILCQLQDDGTLRYMNPAVERVLGHRARDMVGRSVFEFIHPEDADMLRALFSSPAGTLEARFRHRDDGRWIHLEMALCKHCGGPSDAVVDGWIVNARDVTGQRRLEEQLRQSQKMEAVGRLAAGVAHDFNNLLTAINGYSELLQARLDEGDPQHQVVAEIRKAGRRAAGLTRRLLILSKHRVASRHKLSLNRVVADMEKLLRRVIGEDIELRTRLEPALGPIYADQGQIEQVMLNLAVNASDAMPNGGLLEIVTRNVSLEGRNYALLSARDTGRGMGREVRERVFEPFYTTKETGENTGLGLAIVYGIVQQCGGRIEVESSEGSGTDFQLYFPHFVGRGVGAYEQGELDSARLPRGDETVLLVEDEEAVRSLVQQVLELQGYRVWSAPDAMTAIEICDLDDRRPDLLLTDVVMPVKSGIALAEDLRARYDDLRILFMSGYADSHSGVRLVTERQATLLEKPFSPEVLALKVREVLDGPAS